MRESERGPTAQERSVPRERRAFPKATLGLTILLTLSVFAILLSSYMFLNKRIESTWVRTERLTRLQGDISRLDEVLTSSARLAVLTGDPAWIERYKQNESALDSAIESVAQVFPDSTLRSLASEVEQANLELLALEEDAFEALRNGDPEEAKRTLFSATYQTYKELYADAVRRSFEELEDIAAEERLTVRKAASNAVMIFCFLLVAMIILWVWLWNSIDFYVERKHSLEARLKSVLKDQRTNLRRKAQLLDEARDAIIERDLSGRIVFWNKGAERLFGWQQDELLGQNLAELLHYAPDKSRAAAEVTLEKGHWNGELAARTKDGRAIVAESRWTLLRDENSRPRGVLSISTDVSETKLLQAQLMRAQRLESVGTLASGIAHDLNNALTPVLMGIQMLRRKAGDENRRTLEMIETSAQRGVRMVQEVLRFGRGGSQERVVLDVAGAAKHFGEIADQIFPKSVRLHVDMPTGLWAILADPTQIDQVLMNLGVNARDAMPDGGTLTIRATNVNIDKTNARRNSGAIPGPYVLLEVADSGVGIPEDIVSRVFDPFFTTKEVGEGTGLGLSIVYKIVADHGGFVNLDTEAGRGTSFKIYLPASEADRNEPVVETSLKVSGGGQTVLIADDEEYICEMASVFLEGAGYSAVCVKNGAEAVTRYGKGAIDFVLVDWDMPVMDGLRTIRAIQELDPKARIIASSGIPHQDELNALGISVRFLHKPYTGNELLNELTELGAGSGTQGATGELRHASRTLKHAIQDADI